ncbi:hypothetical protein [Streptomyces sp. WAC00469]|uniref:hypothetical protein n=1 Tax=Streptomyces sp. WAC00469 TaxID=2487415 RepID=UPI0021AF51AE|nr:hypothetical protein [Streptomyces sp. WAC00469]
MPNVPDINPDINRPADYERLLALPAMTAWTAARQKEHAADADAYAAALAAVQSGLRSQHVEGDGRFSAALRSRKVEKHLRKAVKAAREQERAMEALRTAYADHVHHVAALPGQREAKRQAKEARKAGARRLASDATAKSLHKTAAASLAPAPETTTTDTTDQAAPVRGINDLWKRGA